MTRPMWRLAVCVLGAVLLLVAVAVRPAHGGKPSWMMRLRVNGELFEGLPVHREPHEVTFLLRDGSMKSFHPREASGLERVNQPFESYSASDIRNSLVRELGSGFQVTGTGNYLVAHPRGEKDQWAARFEDLYRAFRQYFQVRGVPLKDPPFPMVAIVWKTEEEFFRYAHGEGVNIGRGVMGYYSPLSNRITLFDVTRGKPNNKNWYMNAETIIHEAAHQTAFNTGLHSRFGTTPKWVVEGLGTLFEAPGVWNSAAFTRQQDRINRVRLEDFRAYVNQGRPKGSLLSLIGSDRLFQTNVAAAYAESWAFSFYLMETRPREYARILLKTADRPSFEDYSSSERVADFISIFGKDIELLETNFLQYMSRIR